jgi:hypothetical protein
MKTVLILLRFTLHLALCIVQPDSAGGLDSTSRMRFPRRQKARNAFLRA